MDLSHYEYLIRQYHIVISYYWSGSRNLVGHHINMRYILCAWTVQVHVAQTEIPRVESIAVQTGPFSFPGPELLVTSTTSSRFYAHDGCDHLPLLQLPEELWCGALGRAVLEMEDYNQRISISTFPNLRRGALSSSHSSIQSSLGPLWLGFSCCLVTRSAHSS